MPQLSVEKADILQFLSEKTITYDYLADYSKVRRFYSFSPTEIDRALLARREQAQKAPRRMVAEALLSFNRRIGADEAALKNIRLLSEDDTYAVVTGQQPGFLTGPLYTIYKALTAIKICEKLNGSRKEQFVPVFWSATSDHDIAEVDHTFFIDKDNNLHRLGYVFAERFRGGAVGPVPIDQEILSAALSEIENRTYPTEFRDSIIAMAKEAYSSTWGDGFAALLSKLIGRMGLVLLDPEAKEIKQSSAPIFRREIDEPLVSTKLANEAGDEIERTGYKRQVFKAAEDVNFFLTVQGKRVPVSFRDGRFWPDHASIGEGYSREDMLKWLEERPEDFSPNVLLRPVVQDYLLNTAVYIGGPAEVAYFGQLKGVYEHFQTPMPVVALRLGATIIEKRIARIIDKFRLNFIDLREEVESVFSKMIEESTDLEGICSKIKDDLDKALAPLYDAASQIDQTLVGRLKKVQGNMVHLLDQVELRLVRAAKEHNDTTREQLVNARNNLFPDGAPQERRLNIMPFLIKYGPDFIDDLYRSLPGEAGTHYVVTIG